MKKIIVFAIIAIVFASCSKEFEERNITYRFERGPSSGVVSYLYEDSLYTEDFNVSAVPMKLWEKSLKGRQGDPVYMVLMAKNADAFATVMMTFQASIIVDGKAIKALNQFNREEYTVKNNVDTFYYIRLYGTVPF
jgi:hypothetical protein